MCYIYCNFFFIFAILDYFDFDFDFVFFRLARYSVWFVSCTMYATHFMPVYALEKKLKMVSFSQWTRIERTLRDDIDRLAGVI